MSDSGIAPEYVAARRALLDALELLAPQREGLILVGAQAVHLRTSADLSPDAPYTTDGDLAVDPDLLSDDPDMGQVLLDSGYSRLANPGSFLSPNGVEIDLMVPEGVATGSSRRSAPLAGQSHFTARRTAGLEVALVDADAMRIGSLDTKDRRELEVRVAGAAALTIAKLTKLRERFEAPRRDRIISKDAGDLLRLFRYCDAATIGGRLGQLAAHETAGPVTGSAISFLGAELADRSSALVALAVEARNANESESQVAEAFRVLGHRMLTAFVGE